jgi:mRNA-degrading endonuclease YafQ of YafQ-DinJ toxin-antitoxin module
VAPYTITASETFLRRASRFFRKHPTLRPRFERLVEALRVDPFAPHLRLHQLRGELDGLYAVSLTYQYRVVLTVRLTEHDLLLVDIGSHDDVYR